MAFLQSVGKFFGVSSAKDDDTIQEWQNTIERKLKKGEFGINLKKSFSSVHRVSSVKLLSNARKVLSLVEAAQMEDENSEGEMEIGVRSAAKPCLEITVNKMYYKEDEIDFQAKTVKEVSSKSAVSLSSSEESVSHAKVLSIAPVEIIHKFDSDILVIKTRKSSEHDVEQPSSGNNMSKTSLTKSGVEDTTTDVTRKDTLPVDDMMEDGKNAESTCSAKARDAPERETSEAVEDTKDAERSERASDVPEKGTSEVENKTDAEDSEARSPALRPEDIVYGKDAYLHYKFYTQLEKKSKIRDLEWELKNKMDKFDWKVQAVDELVTLAKDYYWNPKSKNADRWRALKKRVKRSSSHQLAGSANRRKLDSIPEYKPFFTVFIILVQLICFGAVCILGGFTSIGLEPRLSLEDDVLTVFGMETVHKWTPPNVWIGPNQKHLIRVGGVFAPCMREDIEIQLLYSQQNLSTHTQLGCCEIKSRNIAATTTRSECSSLTEGVGVWTGSSTCSERLHEESSVRHALKPCCVGNKGQCRLLSFKHCNFLNGHFHKNGPEHCSQVNCLQFYCNLGNLQPSTDQPWLPESPNQWWRVPLSLQYHNGIIDLALVALAQWLLQGAIETTAGWLRVAIIYLMSGTGALLISAVMDPYRCHVGAVGAVFGMIGVTLMELVQFWAIIQSPVRELIKLLSAVLLFLLFGTLPYLNIFGMFGGLVIGALTGIILLPYISFSKWKTRIRIVLIAIALPLLLVIFLILSHVFKVVQTTSNCKFCKILNCVPYTDKMCDVELWQQ